MDEIVLPEQPLTISGDGEFTNTIYCKTNNTVFINATPEFIKRFEYMEKMVLALTAPNREKYKEGSPDR